MNDKPSEWATLRAHTLLLRACPSDRERSLVMALALDAARRQGLEEAANALKETDESIRLHAGELSAREMRAVQAVLKWKASAIRALAAKAP